MLIEMPMLDSADGRETLRNWLACGLPIVERSAPSTATTPPPAVGDTVPPFEVMPLAPNWGDIYERLISHRCASAPCHGSAREGEPLEHAYANGAPSIRAAGETKVLTIDANGAGQLDVHKLRAATVHVDSKGVATVEVYASEQLDVTISGPSSVIYHGSPVVNKTIHGPGQVEKKESGS